MKENAQEIPVLVAQSGKLSGVRWALEKPKVVIGRSPECDFVIPDRQVSRQHIEITRQAEGYVIEDLGSKNGTYLNGSVVEGATVLQDGDVIQVALAMQLIFVGREATIPLSSIEAAQMGLGRLRLDSKAHRAWVEEKEIDPPLSLPQFRLLEILYENPDRVVSRDEVVEVVWPESAAEGVSEQAIDALVRRLRERINEVDPSHAYIITVRGHGFRFDNPI
jgi:predicted component of type VI protein secretion system